VDGERRRLPRAALEVAVSSRDGVSADRAAQAVEEAAKARFPNATIRPRYAMKPLPKTINLQELGAFWQAIQDTMPLGELDYLEMRKQSGWMPRELPEDDAPEVAETVAPDETPETAETTAETDIEADTGETMPDEESAAGELSTPPVDPLMLLEGLHAAVLALEIDTERTRNEK
jgi:hypothetical protein